MDQKLLEVNNIKKWYVQRIKTRINMLLPEKKIVKPVDDISFELDEGEILGVIGESGCGKSTLGRMLIRLENPTSGTICLKGVSSDELLRQDQLKFRRMVQMIFQVDKNLLFIILEILCRGESNFG